MHLGRRMRLKAAQGRQKQEPEDRQQHEYGPVRAEREGDSSRRGESAYLQASKRPGACGHYPGPGRRGPSGRTARW